MRAILAPVGAKFADTYEPVTSAAQCATLTANSVAVVLRYENLTASELALLLDNQLLVGLLVTAPEPNTPVSASLAQQKYQAALEHFTGLDVPATASVIADFETFGGPTADRVAYCNAAAAVIASAGLGPACYGGAGMGLTSAELTDLAVTRYVKSLSRVTDPAGDLVEPACGWCGYQVFPGNQSLPNGLCVDFGMLGTDYEGRALALVGP